jgi:hypothetical protein
MLHTQAMAKVQWMQALWVAQLLPVLPEHLASMAQQDSQVGC